MLYLQGLVLVEGCESFCCDGISRGILHGKAQYRYYTQISDEDPTKRRDLLSIHIIFVYIPWVCYLGRQVGEGHQFITVTVIILVHLFS